LHFLCPLANSPGAKWLIAAIRLIIRHLRHFLAMPGARRGADIMQLSGFLAMQA
jgi:hypothetical protein